MNWEAFIVIGLVTLGLGVLLFVPAWLWAKHRQRTDPAARVKLKLTKLGWLLTWLGLMVFLGGFSLQYIAPKSMLGQLVQTSGGRFLYLVIVICVFWILEAALKARGIKLIEEDQTNTNTDR